MRNKAQKHVKTNGKIVVLQTKKVKHKVDDFNYLFQVLKRNLDNNYTIEEYVGLQNTYIITFPNGKKKYVLLKYTNGGGSMNSQKMALPFNNTKFISLLSSPRDVEVWGVYFIQPDSDKDTEQIIICRTTKEEALKSSSYIKWLNDKHSKLTSSSTWFAIEDIQKSFLSNDVINIDGIDKIFPIEKISTVLQRDKSKSNLQNIKGEQENMITKEINPTNIKTKPEILVQEFINGCRKANDPLSTVVVYKIPYKVLKEKSHDLDKTELCNRFINYILVSRKKNLIYVGKSKNGIDNRPVSHEDKCNEWTECYIITMKTNDFLNDGIIQYIENELNIIASDLEYYTNVTCQTTKNTANSKEENRCEQYINKAIELLSVLSLDLTEIREETPFVDEDEETVQLITDLPPFEISSTKPSLEELMNTIKSVNNKLEFVKKESYHNVVLDGKILLTLHTKKNGTDVYFRAKDEDFDNSLNFLTYVHKDAHRIGNWKMFVSSTEQYPILINYINQCINL